MDTPEKQALIQNAGKIVEALAKILLAEGISYSEFNELARSSFVQAARQVLFGEKRVTDARIAVITGIHRKDVRRLGSIEAEGVRPERAKSNRAVAVISAWTREKDYCNNKGEPLPLPYAGDASSLSALIRDYSGDMPVRAVCDELQRMGVIEERDGLWHLSMPVYVPSKSREAILDYLGEDTSRLIGTIQHNLNTPPKQRRFQRSVAYDELAPQSVGLFHEFASERAMDLLRDFDVWLAEREKIDKASRANTPEIERRKAGVGIYFFEEIPATQPAGDGQ